MSPRVVVVGSVNVDLVLRCAHLPVAGETVVASGAEQGPGGKGGNQAAAAARSAPTSLVAAVGQDGAGPLARDDLAAAGVDVTHVVTVPGSVTGRATVLVDGSGENAVVVVAGANAALTAAHVRAALVRLALRPGDVVLTGAEVPPDAAATAARLGAASGATCLHNPAPYRDDERWWRELRPLVVLNAVEARQATGEPDPQRAALALAALVPAAVVTVGAAGALVACGTDLQVVPAPRVRAVDTTGAGDAFCGALAAALAGGATLSAGVEAAVAHAAYAVTVAGARA